MVGEKIFIGLVVVNYQGKVVVNCKLKVSFYWVEWCWWWDDEDGNGGCYVCDCFKEEIVSSIVMFNVQGCVFWEVEIKCWGRYFIIVCDVEIQYCSSGYVYVGFFWYNEGIFLEEVSMFIFQVNKDDYVVGEDIIIIFFVGGVGWVLLSLEIGDGVLEEIWLDIKLGDNIYIFKVSFEMVLIVYVFLMVF